MSIRVVLSGWEDIAEEKLVETVRMEERRRSLLLSDPSRDVDGVLMARLSDSFVYHYPYENLRNLYTKTTVSELKMAGMREETDFSFQMYEEETVVPYLPGFLEKDESVSGSMRGSAFHKVMELFDFAKLTKEVSCDEKAVEALLNRQLEEMRLSGRLSEEYYAVISVPKLKAFLKSRVAVRMGEAAAGAAGPSSAAAACKQSGAVSGAYGTFSGHGGLSVGAGAFAGDTAGDGLPELCGGKAGGGQAARQCGDAAGEGGGLREDELLRPVSFPALYGAAGKV